MNHLRQTAHASLESLAADMRATLNRVAEDVHALVAAMTVDGKHAPLLLPATGQPACSAPAGPPTPPTPHGIAAARPPEPPDPPTFAHPSIRGQESLPQPPAAPPREVVVAGNAPGTPAVSPAGTESARAPAPAASVAEASGPNLPTAPAWLAGWSGPAAGPAAVGDLQAEFQRLAAAQARQYEEFLRGLRSLTQQVLRQNQQVAALGRDIAQLSSVVANARNQR